MENALAGRTPVRLRRPARLLRLASDERLVALLRAGEEGAFEAIYDRHHPAILGFCRHMLGTREEAEDAVQHTFLAAFRDLLRSDKPIELRPWLFAIARNRCVSLLRARRAHVAIEVAEPATDGLAATVERREDLRELLADLARLPEDQRAALLLAELGAFDHAGIARVLGCPRDKVKALVFQARTSLAASREARATPCEQIRLELATASGAALRRGPLRRHLRACDGCRAFKAEVALQRKLLAVALPVVPSVALKAAVLSGGGGASASGGGAMAAASAAGGGAASGASGGTLGGVLGTVASTGAGKVVVSVAVAGMVASGGALTERLAHHAAAPPRPSSARSPAGSGEGAGVAPASPFQSRDSIRSAAMGSRPAAGAADPLAGSAPHALPPAAGGAPAATGTTGGPANDEPGSGGAADPGRSPAHATPADPPQPVPSEGAGRAEGATPPSPTPAVPPPAASSPPAPGDSPGDASPPARARAPPAPPDDPGPDSASPSGRTAAPRATDGTPAPARASAGDPPPRKQPTFATE